MSIRDLRRGEFEGGAALYFSRFEELATNPALGLTTLPIRPSLGEEAARFGTVRKRIPDGDPVASVAESGASVVGLCTADREGRGESHPAGDLGIALRPEHRGREVGSALVGRVLAKGEGRFDILRSSVLSGNEPARRLDRRFGFVERGRVPGDVPARWRRP